MRNQRPFCRCLDGLLLRIPHFAFRIIFWLVVVGIGRGAEKVDFAREVLPILSDACFHCHGPDDQGRKAKLRLDTHEGAFAKRDGPAILVAGKSHESELYKRLISTDTTEQMPPPKSGRKLSAKQIDTLKRWIDQGATWGKHWAFESLRSPPVPKSTWGSSPIDAFVKQRLDRSGLRPSPSATKEAWLRRVTLDLTGLPPTLPELDAYLKDASPNAEATVVDRLFKSQRYGERMATEWLDVARFADTHGFQSDRARSVWPYRDWVIQAFQRNQRFDEFLTWQLAGDLLPNPTKEQRLATAFNRLHMQNEEGGIVEEEFRVAYVVDRVTTMGTAFMGLTLECTRCHDHKYDPLTMKDFYGLFAFFQNIDESGQTSYFTAAMPVPTLLLSTPEQDAKLAELRNAIRTQEQSLTQARTAAKEAFPTWFKTRPKELPLAGRVASFSFDELKGAALVNGVNDKQTANPHEGPKLVPGKKGNGVELNGENGYVFPNIGHLNRTQPFSISLWLKASSHAPRAVVLHHSMAPVDAGSRGYELLLEEGRVAFGMHHMWPGNSLKVQAKKPLALNTWTHVLVTYDGSSRANGTTVYLDGTATDVAVVRDGLRKDITYGNEPNLALGYRFRDNGFKGGSVDELQLYQRALTALEAKQLAGQPLPDDEASWQEYFTNLHHEPTTKALGQLQQARQAENSFVNPIPEIMVMDEMPTPKPAYILKRGAYDAPGDRVTPSVPTVLPPLKKDNKLPNRLDFARWLTQPDHPLTARVTVNRLWQQMFGRGLVETSDNFGSQGTPPTHPELLDWLATDFIAHGWDVQHTLKQIALSATYRQAAKVTPELLAQDPTNELLARMPSRRLTAEMLRDQALFVSGLLVEQIGGPSVYPYQPDGLWNEAMGRPNYPRSKGNDLYRRGLYTFWKRTAPPPTMLTFDAADRSNCAVRRQATSTPLQALVLLNDPQLVEAARFLAQRMLLEGGATPRDHAAWAFRLTTSRSASERELTILVKLYEEQLAELSQSPKDVEKLLNVGDRKNVATVDKTKLAATTAVALAILNHDGAVMRR